MRITSYLMLIPTPIQVTLLTIPRYTPNSRATKIRLGQPIESLVLPAIFQKRHKLHVRAGPSPRDPSMMRAQSLPAQSQMAITLQAQECWIDILELPRSKQCECPACIRVVGPCPCVAV